jgi:MSHA biogenesis protein MshP
MTLVAALFLVVVLGALGLFAVRIGASQQTATDLAVLTDRAATAANYGIEWAAVAPGACPSATLTPAAPLSDFTVTVTCVPHANGVAITSRATFGAYGSPEFVSRTVHARLPSS